MKIICINNSTENMPISMSFKPQTCLLNKNRPFFIPSFSENIQPQLNIALKINKLGKNISPKFAHTYIGEYGAAINFLANDVFIEQKEKGLPTDIAANFDYSCALQSKMLKFENMEKLNNEEFLLLNNNKIIDTVIVGKLHHNIAECIAFISKYTTLKIGDIILIGKAYTDIKLNINDKLEVRKDDEILLYTEIK